MNLLLTRLHRLRPSSRLFLNINFVSSEFSNRHLSAAASQSPLPKPHFSAADYLIQSCALSSEEALRASKKIDHLKIPNKPNAVLQFLRETGIDESDIKTAVLRDSRILRSSVENNLRPNVAKLQEVGFSNSDISSLISRYPGIFQFNIVLKIDFWLRSLGSLENLSVVLRRAPRLLASSMEKVIVPNLSILQKQLGLSVSQIVLLIRQAPYLMLSTPQVLMLKVKKAEELGVRCSSGMFVYALILASNLSQHTIEARLNNLGNLGFSLEEVSTLVSKRPLVLKQPEELLGRKVQFLINEVGCDKLHVIGNSFVLTNSLEKRLIPRNLVLKLLKSKGFSVGKKSFLSVAKLNENQFVENIVLPYEHTIPGLQRAYTEACAGKSSAREWFKSISN